MRQFLRRLKFHYALLLVCATAFAVLVVVNAGGSNSEADAAPRTEDSPQRVVVGKVQNASSGGSVRFASVISAERSSDLAFGVSGRVTKRFAEVGSRVLEGDPLAALDRETYRSALRRARARLQKSQAQLEHASRRRDKTTKLTQASAVAKDAEEDSVLQAELAKATREEASAAVTQARDTLDEGVLRAPFDGIVVRCDTEVGEHVQAGKPVMRILDDTSLRVEFGVPAPWLDSLHQGMTLDLFLPRSGRSVVGVVHSVSDAATDTDLFRVAVSVEKTPQLKAGMDAEVLLSRPSRKGFSVPVEAVVDRVEGEPMLYLVERGQVSTRPVNLLGLEDGVAIVDGDLREGMTVVTRGHLGLTAGQRVMVSQ